MYQYFIKGGPFILPMVVGLVLLIFIAYRNLFNQYHTDCLILIGAATSLFGVFATAIGINNAMNFSNDMSKIAPHIMFNGIKTSLITTYFGSFNLSLSILLWYYYRIKYKSPNV